MTSPATKPSHDPAVHAANVAKIDHETSRLAGRGRRRMRGAIITAFIGLFFGAGYSGYWLITNHNRTVTNTLDAQHPRVYVTESDYLHELGVNMNAVPSSLKIGFTQPCDPSKKDGDRCDTLIATIGQNDYQFTLPTDQVVSNPGVRSAALVFNNPVASFYWPGSDTVAVPLGKAIGTDPDNPLIDPRNFGRKTGTPQRFDPDILSYYRSLGIQAALQQQLTKAYVPSS